MIRAIIMAIALSGPAFANSATSDGQTSGIPLIADMPQVRTWSSILVYSDKTYDLKEGIASEHACRESLCFVQWQVGCDEHQKRVEIKKHEAELQEIERKKTKALYMQSHPCKINANGYKECPTSDDTMDTYDKDGKLMWSTMRGTSTVGFSTESRSIQVAACFQ